MKTLATTALITAALTLLAIACTPHPAETPAVTRPTPAIQQTTTTAQTDVPPPATTRPTPNLRPTYTPHPTVEPPPTHPPTNGVSLAPPPPPPTLTETATPAPTAAVDTNHPVSVYHNMSSQERDCLGADITTDTALLAAVADLLAAVKDSPLTPADNIMDCLGDHSQFQLYMMTSEGTDELTEATHRCIWNAMRPLGDIASMADDESPEQAMAFFRDLMMFVVTVPSYCAATQQPELAGLTHIEGDPNDAEVICMIEAAGGLDEWTRLILSENASFLDFIDATNQACATAAP